MSKESGITPTPAKIQPTEEMKARALAAVSDWLLNNGECHAYELMANFAASEMASLVSRVTELEKSLERISLIADAAQPGKKAIAIDEIQEVIHELSERAKRDMTPERKMDGIERIATERKRQIEREGYDTAHDDLHSNYELSAAACCYAQMGNGGPYSHTISPPDGWPWHEDDWKPKRDPIANLVRAGALIAAEIDRLTRAKGGA